MLIKRLNVGFGGVRIEGFDHLDIDPKWEPDILADARNMHMIPASTYDVVYSYGFIEHIEPKDVHKVLSEMRRVMKVGGWLQIGTEDFAHQARLYLRKGINSWLHSAVYGPHYSHRSLWDEYNLERALRDAGFTEVERIKYEERKECGYDFPRGIIFMVARKCL